MLAELAAPAHESGSSSRGPRRRETSRSPAFMNAPAVSAPRTLPCIALKPGADSAARFAVSARRCKPFWCLQRHRLQARGGQSRRPVSTLGRGSRYRLAVKRCALGPSGRPVGDGGAGHPLGGGEVEPGARHGRDGDGDVLLQSLMSLGVIGGVVLPAAPDDAAPGAPEGAQRAGVIVTARASGGVVVLGPGMPVTGAVG